LGLSPHRTYDRRLGLAFELGDAGTRPRQGVAPTARADAEQQPSERERLRRDVALDDCRRSIVERDHADAERDGGGVGSCDRERVQARVTGDVVDPERRVTEPFRLGRDLADDLARDPCTESEAKSHRLSLAAVTRVRSNR
jgi:hypothetical protein